MPQNDNNDPANRASPLSESSTDWMNETVGFNVPRGVLIAGGIVLLVVFIVSNFFWWLIW